MVPVAAGAMALDASQPGLPANGPSARSSAESEYVPHEGEFVPYKLGGVAENAEVDIDWEGGIKGQGNPWELYVQQKYPNIQKLAPGSKTFDHFDQLFYDAISDKTLNTLTYSRITNPQSIYGKLTQYVDAAANYTPRASIDVDPSLIRTKTIQLAVPEYTSAEQWQYISRAVQYGRQKGVSVIVTRIKSTSWSGRN
jgi:filamentous hemagglutinin